jgi:hypothetical protein
MIASRHVVVFLFLARLFFGFFPIIIQDGSFVSDEAYSIHTIYYLFFLSYGD